MNTKPTDLAELRRLHEAATEGDWVADYESKVGTRCILKGDAIQTFPMPAADAVFIAAAHNALPALLDELEAAREKVREESNRWVSVIRGIDPEALCDFHDEHGSQEYLKAWLDARDRHTKLIGAAEKLEQLAQDRENGGLCRRLRVLLCDYDHTDAPRDMTITRGLIEAAELLEIAAQLRREAGE